MATDFERWWAEYQRPYLPNGLAGHDSAQAAWAAAELRGQQIGLERAAKECADYAEKCLARAKSMGRDESFGIVDKSYAAAYVANLLSDEIRSLAPLPSYTATVEQRVWGEAIAVAQTSGKEHIFDIRQTIVAALIAARDTAPVNTTAEGDNGSH